MNEWTAKILHNGNFDEFSFYTFKTSKIKDALEQAEKYGYVVGIWLKSEKEMKECL